jgi:U3 small nucleolar RNA-associated protein 14
MMNMVLTMMIMEKDVNDGGDGCGDHDSDYDDDEDGAVMLTMTAPKCEMTGKLNQVAMECSYQERQHPSPCAILQDTFH